MNNATSALATIDPRQISEAKRLYQLADEAARNAVASVGKSVRLAHQCGTVLLAIRAAYPEIRGGDKTGQTKRQIFHMCRFAPLAGMAEKELGFQKTRAALHSLPKCPSSRPPGQLHSPAYQLAGVLPPQNQRAVAIEIGFNPSPISPRSPPMRGSLPNRPTDGKTASPQGTNKPS